MSCGTGYKIISQSQLTTDTGKLLDTWRKGGNGEKGEGRKVQRVREGKEESYCFVQLRGEALRVTISRIECNYLKCSDKNSPFHRWLLECSTRGTSQ